MNFKKLFLVTILCLFSSVSWSQDYEQDQEYLPIKKVAPFYPARALMRNLEGYCDISFTITPAGTTADPVTEYCTNLIFERTSQRAVLRYEYEPRVVDGVPQTVTGVLNRISYLIGGGNLAEQLAQEEREIERKKEKERERDAEKEEQQRERQARRDEFFAKNESLYSDYKYGTKEKPIVKDFELADVGIYVHLDFGKGVKIRAVRGYLYCIDVFGDQVIAKSVEDKVIEILSNEVLNTGKSMYNNSLDYWSENETRFNRYKYKRPVESTHNRASFKTSDRAILEAGGIERCAFIPTTIIDNDNKRLDIQTENDKLKEYYDQRLKEMEFRFGL